LILSPADMTNVTILLLEHKASKYWNNLMISLLHEGTKKPVTLVERSRLIVCLLQFRQKLNLKQPNLKIFSLN